MSEPLPLLRALEAATEADLEAVRAAIAADEAHLATLRSLERVLLARLGMKVRTPRAPAPPGDGEARRRPGRAPSDETKARRLAVARLLSEDGPTPASVVRNRLALPQASLYHLLDCPWFSKGPSGYTLTPEGGRALAEAPS